MFGDEIDKMIIKKLLYSGQNVVELTLKKKKKKEKKNIYHPSPCIEFYNNICVVHRCTKRAHRMRAQGWTIYVEKCSVSEIASRDCNFN